MSQLSLRSRLALMVVPVIGLTGLILAAGGIYVIEPGQRGVLVTLGTVDPVVKPEGVGFKMPLVSSVIQVSVRQATAPLEAPCFSSDLQQVNVQAKVLYSIPEGSVVRMYQEYAGNPFDSLIAPRIQEALKEHTATMSAEQIVKNREGVKTAALEAARKKIGNALIVHDLVIENIDLSDELERAIEAKMVQEQEAAKAKFVQQQAEIEAQTEIIKARGEAESIRIRAEALAQSRSVIELKIVEKWDGKAPLYVGSGSGTDILLPAR